MANITKHDLITDISIATGISQKDTRQVVEYLLDFIPHYLSKMDTIELRGFGTFIVKRRKGRPVRNPRTGEDLRLEDRMVPTLRFCESVKKKVQEL